MSLIRQAETFWENQDILSRVASFTPLPVKWPHAVGPLSSRVSIVARPTFDEKEWKTMFNMRRSEEQAVLQVPHWMCVEKDSGPYHNPHSWLQKTGEDVRTGILGFQIWCPKGWSAIIVNSEHGSDGALRVVTVSFPESYVLSEWSNLVKVEDQPLEELARIIDGTFAALESEATSVKNPFQYLEIGLQTAVNHFRAGALLWMIGLDSLLGAGGRDSFKARLCHLLGEQSYAFPKDYAGRQPAYKVGELAGDIYELRNQIAHGDRIRDPFLAKGEFRLEPGLPEFFRVRERSHQSILCEAALFMLCGLFAGSFSTATCL